MSPSFDPQKDIPNLEGKVILVTGGTAGVGARSVVQLAQRNPAHIYFTGRNAQSADAVVREAAAAGSTTKIQFLPCDLASLTSVKGAAERVLAEQSRLDVVLANAGIMDAPASLTADGYELQFGVNYLGHALLIRKLLPLLERTATAAARGDAADVRVVMLTSTAFRGAPRGGVQLDRVRTVQNDFLLMAGLLADLLLARELARRYPAVLSVSVTPGIVGTDLVHNLSPFLRGLAKVSACLGQGGLIKPEDGARSQLWCVGAPRCDMEPGGFYEPVGVLSKVATGYSTDIDLARRLWEWTDAELEKWM